MDDTHFDELVKRLGAGLDRRRALRNALGGLVAAVGGAAALEAEAKKGQQAKSQGKAKKAKKAKGQDKHKGKQKLQAQAELVCRNFRGSFCIQGSTPENLCCSPNYVCADNTAFGSCTANPPGGAAFGCYAADPEHTGCQCAPHFIPCEGQCISESHCCTDNKAGCPTGQTCTQHSNGTYTCVAPTTTTTPQCIPDGSPVNQFHPCCSGCAVGGLCAAASHCATTTTVAPTTTTTTVAPTTTTTTPPVVGCTAEEIRLGGVTCTGTGKKANVVKCCPKGAVCDISKSGEPNCRKK